MDTQHSGVWSWAGTHPIHLYSDITTAKLPLLTTLPKSSPQRPQYSDKHHCIGWRSHKEPQNLFQLSVSENKATLESLSLARCFSSSITFQSKEQLFSVPEQKLTLLKAACEEIFATLSTQPGLSSPLGAGETSASLNQDTRFPRHSAWKFRVYHRHFSAPGGGHCFCHSRESDSTNLFLISSLRKLVHRWFLDLLYFSSLLFYYQLAAQNSG